MQRSVLSATRPETLCFVSVSPLARLKTFYLFCESDCRYKTDVRSSENLQRFAQCCTQCCTDVALRCTETPQFLLQCRALSRQIIARGTLSNARHPARIQTLGEGLYAAPFLGMETRRGFGAAGWVLAGVLFSTFFGVSACIFNAFRRGQACWSKRSRVTFFDDAPSEATCAPPSQRAQRPLSARLYFSS